MTPPYHAPPRASFIQKLGPGGAASLGLAILTTLGLGGLPWLLLLIALIAGTLVWTRRLAGDRGHHRR